MLMHNFAHADLHPGNLILRKRATRTNRNANKNTPPPPPTTTTTTAPTTTPTQREEEDGTPPASSAGAKGPPPPRTLGDLGLELVVLDCGLVAQLPTSELQVVISMLDSTLQGQYDKATKTFLSTCARPEFVRDRAELETRVKDFLRRVHRRQLEGGVSYLESLSELAAIRREHRFQMRSNYSPLIVGSLVVEGTCQGKCNVVEALVKLFEGQGSEILQFYVAATEGAIIADREEQRIRIRRPR